MFIWIPQHWSFWSMDTSLEASPAFKDTFTMANYNTHSLLGTCLKSSTCLQCEFYWIHNVWIIADSDCTQRRFNSSIKQLKYQDKETKELSCSLFCRILPSWLNYCHQVTTSVITAKLWIKQLASEFQYCKYLCSSFYVNFSEFNLTLVII